MVIQQTTPATLEEEKAEQVQEVVPVDKAEENKMLDDLLDDLMKDEQEEDGDGDQL